MNTNKKNSFSGKRITLFIFLIHYFLVSNSQIVINEFSASNATQIADPNYGDYSDWIELYNAGSVAQNLDGYYLTNGICVVLPTSLTNCA